MHDGINPAKSAGADPTLDLLDRRDGLVYIMPKRLALAVDVALHTGRPLLLRGEPGSGKSTLAAFVARTRGWRYYEHVVTSRTQARDLLWTYDSVRRLGDAQTRAHPDGTDLGDADYVQPGALWWAFAPESARYRGAPSAPRSEAIEPNAVVNKDRSRDHAVVLIDEIDKAEPDMPNGLLVPLGSSEFVVTETNHVVSKAPPSAPLESRLARHLVVLTTNEERELPQAFLRRCVVAWLDQPRGDELIEIAKAHLNAYDDGYTQSDEELVRGLIEAYTESRDAADRLGIRAPSTAEFLDALRACRGLDITVGSDEWEQLRELTLIKRQQSAG
jgi:MoxR-like ATPase